MKGETRQHISKLIVEELSEKIKSNEALQRRLETFADLPVEKVAEAIIRQFEYLLSSDLRDLIFHLIEQDIALEKVAQSPPAIEPVEAESEDELTPATADLEAKSDDVLVSADTSDRFGEVHAPPVSSESIMEHFAVREPFRSEPITVIPQPDDWFYLYGVSYAPDSTGKGDFVRQLGIKGIDNSWDILLLDEGDIRLYLSKLPRDVFSLEKEKPVYAASKSSHLRYEHERVLNILRGEELIVPMHQWSVVKGREEILRQIEARYTDILRVLIDVHDAVEWDVEIFALDEHFMQLPSIAEGASDRSPDRIAGRAGRQAAKKGKTDSRKAEKVVVREKSLAQEIQNELFLLATKHKVDYIITLDTAIMDDWKSILSTRYTVGKEKRRQFCQLIVQLQKKMEEYQLLFKVSNPNTRFSLIP
jgi:hypothetical protein